MYRTISDDEFEENFWKNFEGKNTLKNTLEYFVQNYPYTDESYKRSFAANVIKKHIIGKAIDDRKVLELLDIELAKIDKTKIPQPTPAGGYVTKPTQTTVFDADRLSGNDFQDFMAEILKANEYTDVKVTGKSGDQGGDILATKDEELLVIQAKRFSIDRKVSNSPVQEALGAIGYYNADRGIVVTNSFYTPGAKELAEINNITLWDRRDVIKFIENYNKDLN